MKVGWLPGRGRPLDPQQLPMELIDGIAEQRSHAIAFGVQLCEKLNVAIVPIDSGEPRVQLLLLARRLVVRPFRDAPSPDMPNGERIALMVSRNW